MAAFSDYCKESRNHVFSTINNSKSLASIIVANMIKSAETELESKKKWAEEQKKIQERQTQTKNPFENFMATMEKSRDMVLSRIGQGFEALSKTLGLDHASGKLELACQLADNYDSELRAMFEKAKAKVVVSNPALAKVEYERVPCKTASHVIRAEGFCNFARGAQEQFNKMFHIGKHQTR